MKNKIILLSCSAAVIATLAFWNGEATAQSSSGESGAASDFPLNMNYTITLDARSNSRSAMTKEMQDNSGFVNPDTTEGTLIKVTPQWLILKNMDSEYWVPRDKILLMKVHR